MILLTSQISYFDAQYLKLSWFACLTIFIATHTVDLRVRGDLLLITWWVVWLFFPAQHPTRTPKFLACTAFICSDTTVLCNSKILDIYFLGGDNLIVYVLSMTPPQIAGFEHYFRIPCISHFYVACPPYCPQDMTIMIYHDIQQRRRNVRLFEFNCSTRQPWKYALSSVYKKERCMLAPCCSSSSSLHNFHMSPSNTAAEASKGRKKKWLG